jgi:cbb3-type cytochrome oxidase maturation protein
MSVIAILIFASLSMALLFLGCFFWAVRGGQFEDTTTPSMRVLMDDPSPSAASGGEASTPGPVQSRNVETTAARAPRCDRPSKSTSGINPPN